MRRRFAVVALALVPLVSGVGPAQPVTGSERFPATVARVVEVRRAPAREARRNLAFPIRANMLSVSWTGADGLVDVRWREPGGRWSEWTAAEPSDIGPDPGEKSFDRKVSEPIWVGVADAADVRVRGSGGDVRDVKLHLVNTLGNSDRGGARARLTTAAAGLTRSVFGARHAEAIPSYQTINWRRTWGANESWRRDNPDISQTLEMAFVHHTATTNSYSASQVPGILRGIYHHHVFGRGFNDIAYNFLIDKYGRIWEGRAGGIGNAVIGAHTKGMNGRTTGIALIGTFDRTSPPAAMVSSLERLLAWKLDVHHVPPTGKVLMTSAGSDKFAPNTKVWMNRISGHRDAQATGCPGSRVYNQMSAIRTNVSAMGLPKVYVTERPGAVLRPDGDGVHDSFEVQAWFSPKVSWRVTFTDVSGAVKKVFAGNGYSAKVSWDGRDPAGLLGKTGTGSWKVEAWDSSGRVARPASGPIYLVSDHPDGTLVQSGGARYLLEDGQTRLVPDEVAPSWFRSNEAVAITAEELTRYTPGSPLGWRDGSILVSSSGNYYLVFSGVRRAFESAGTFQALGYTASAALPVGDAALAGIPSGPDISDETLHPDGAVVLDQGVSWVVMGGRRYSALPRVRDSWYRPAEVVPATDADRALPVGGSMTFRPGTLIRSPDGRIWLVSGGQRRHIVNEAMLTALGHSKTAIFEVSYQEAGTLQPGPRIG